MFHEAAHPVLDLSLDLGTQFGRPDRCADEFIGLNVSGFTRKPLATPEVNPSNQTCVKISLKGIPKTGGFPLSLMAINSPSRI
jgi:hypothetical protein